MSVSHWRLKRESVKRTRCALSLFRGETLPFDKQRDRVLGLLDLVIIDVSVILSHPPYTPKKRPLTQLYGSLVAIPVAAEAVTLTGLNLPSTSQQWMSICSAATAHQPVFPCSGPGSVKPTWCEFK